MTMYENAQWVDDNGKHAYICVDINGVQSWVPCDPNNTDYQNIMKLVAQGNLVIAPADA
jgi:hypothetical protein